MSYDSDASDGKGMAGGSARDRFAAAVERVGAVEAERRIREFIGCPSGVNDALNELYARAVAMHESIQAGRGAIGWDDQACRAILVRLREEAKVEALTDARDGLQAALEIMRAEQDQP